MIKTEFSCSISELINSKELQSELKSKSGTYALYNSIDDKYYVGACKTLTFYKRLFGGKSAHIVELINKSDKSQYVHDALKGISFDSIYFMILSYDPNDEEFWIRKLDSYYNGYNRSINGKFNLSMYDKIWVTNGYNNKPILYSELGTYLCNNLGWWKGFTINNSNNHSTSGYTRITNGKENASVPNSDLDKVLLDNPSWYCGITKSNGNGCKGMIWINNGIISTRIRPENLSEYESKGYIRGRL